MSKLNIFGEDGGWTAVPLHAALGYTHAAQLSAPLEAYVGALTGVMHPGRPITVLIARLPHPSLAVLKAHRLKDTSTFGKQDLYLALTAGPNQKKSDVHKGVLPQEALLAHAGCVGGLGDALWVPQQPCHATNKESTNAPL